MTVCSSRSHLRWRHHRWRWPVVLGHTWMSCRISDAIRIGGSQSLVLPGQGWLLFPCDPEAAGLP